MAQLFISAVPGKPINIKVTIPRDESDLVNVSWEAPEMSGGLDVQHYHIRKKEADHDWDLVDIKIRASPTKQPVMTQQVIKLIPEKSYFFGVCAENEMGKGDFADIEEPVTLPKRKGFLILIGIAVSFNIF